MHSGSALLVPTGKANRWPKVGYPNSNLLPPSHPIRLSMADDDYFWGNVFVWERETGPGYSMGRMRCERDDQ